MGVYLSLIEIMDRTKQHYRIHWTKHNGQSAYDKQVWEDEEWTRRFAQYLTLTHGYKFFVIMEENAT
jgi:hypothetical protein